MKLRNVVLSRVFFSTLLLLGALLAGSPVYAHAQDNEEFKALKSFPPDVLSKMRGGAPDEQGRVGLNRTEPFFEAGMQRGAMMTIAVGAVQNNKALVEEGWRALDYTFSRQQLDGSLGDLPKGRETTNAFFLAYMSRGLLVLEGSPMGSQYKDRIDGLLPKLQRVINWLGQPEQIAKLEADNAKATNRCLIVANAFGLSARLMKTALPDPRASRFVEIALQNYDAKTGIFSENAGGDSSYEAVSLIHGSVYLLSNPNGQLESDLRGALHWELGKVSSSGDVSVEGNSRTGLKQETYHGHFKEVNFPEVVQAFYLTCYMTTEREACDTGMRVAQAHLFKH